MRLRLPRHTTMRGLVLLATAAALFCSTTFEAYPQKKDYGGGKSSSSTPVTGGPRGGGVIGIAIDAATTHTSQPPSHSPKRASPPPRRPNPPVTAANRINIPPANENRFVPDEVVLEFAADQSPQAITALAARHRLSEIESANFALTNTTFFLGRITDGRPVRTVLSQLRAEASLRTGQPNYLYTFVQQDGAARGATFEPQPPTAPVISTAAGAAALPASTDPTRYASSKLRLSEAHGLARGSNVLVAVIDSGVDVGHPDLAGTIASNFDALKSPERPHAHGTAIAGAIAARSQMMGVAPGAQILAIRAFAAVGTGTVGFSFAILKGIDHAVAQNARIINMSFAGPADPATSRQLAAAYDKGLVLIAAAGNLGPKAPPQYPAADPNVIAVSATDANDRLYVMANRGKYVAIAAPGVNVLLPAPDGLYQVTSGTSFACAYVSGIAALIFERKPSLAPDEVRQIMQATALDLGPRGKDDQFGAGRADAFQAVMALTP